MVHSIDDTSDERKPNEYSSIRVWHYFYINTITDIICDKFGSKRKRKEKGNFLIFDPKKYREMVEYTI